MKFLIYTFLLFFLASLGLAKSNYCNNCARELDARDPFIACCRRRQLMTDRRDLNTIKGLFIRDAKELDSVKS